MKRPPRLATAILRRLGPQHESLVGDLLEEYRAGRSKGWYWRQALTAMVVGSYREIRPHRVLAVRRKNVKGLIIALVAGLAFGLLNPSLAKLMPGVVLVICAVWQLVVAGLLAYGVLSASTRPLWASSPWGQVLQAAGSLSMACVFWAGYSSREPLGWLFGIVTLALFLLGFRAERQARARRESA